MQRPNREEFILDVRRAERLFQQPYVQADSNGIDTDAIAKILHRAAIWLTPKIVEQYRPEDFTDWSSESQEGLHLAVDQFRETARQVPPDKPATYEQFTDGSRRFRDLVKVLGTMVRDEWMDALNKVGGQAEKWSSEVGWRSRRVNKAISESLLGSYEAPQLLIFAEPNLYVLDPIARFVPGAQGLLDLSVQPSYNTSSLYRDDSGKWHVHLEIRNGVAHGTRVDWSKDAFLRCIEELRVLV
jgi:hypothetical protein